jgi:hypothetical protein
MVCPEGWAHDPIMHTTSCGTPVLATKVMAVVGLVLTANVGRLNLEFLWRMWRLSLHEKPLFRGYSLLICGFALLSSTFIAVVAQAGIQPFSSAIVWCFGAGMLCLFVAISMMTVDEHVGNTLSLILVLDPNTGAAWKQRIKRFAIGLHVALVGCMALSSAWWNASDKGTRHKGTALFTGVCVVFILAMMSLTMLVQRRQYEMQAKMGQRSAQEMETSLKVQKLTTLGLLLSLGPLLAIGVVPQSRELLGTVWLLGLLPFLLGLMCVAATVRCKKLRLQMATTSSKQIIPLNVRPAADSQDTITAAVTHTAAQSKLHRPKVTVRESGLTLRFLEQFFTENKISEDATANDIVNQYVKPHTKDIGGHGSGPFVGLLQNGETNGVRWCGVPTHMVSYSWKYTLAMMLDILRKFEKENPPAPGTSYRYYIDQFALDQWGFGKDVTTEEETQLMQDTLNESIAVPGKMLCMLHPW